MIKELRLQHWKSFEQATLYIDPLTIIIGANASGKSNALDALVFLSRVSKGIGIFQAINGDIGLPPLRGGMEWVCLKPHAQFTLEVIADGLSSTDEDLHYSLTIAVNGTKAWVVQESLSMITWDEKNTANASKTTLFEVETTQKHSTKSAAGLIVKQTGKPSILINADKTVLSQADAFLLKEEALYLLKQLQNISIFDPIPSHMRNYTALSEQLLADGSNIAGVLAGLAPARKQEVEQTLTHYLRALPERDIQRVWTETVGKFNSDAMLYCAESWAADRSHEIDARGMSDGTLRYLGIITALLTRDPHSLLVIEEVDNGLHPSRAHILLDMLKTLGQERSIDVIVTTHNPALLDAAGVTMLPFITVAHRNELSGVSELKQLEDLTQLPKLLAAGSLGKLSSSGRTNQKTTSSPTLTNKLR